MSSIAEEIEVQRGLREAARNQQLPGPPDFEVPKTFWQAMKDPEWVAAINKERLKFEVNHCLAELPYVDQHLFPMRWLFNVKTDGTKKARLVGRGDMMIPWVDFDPNAVYCGNVAASSIKMALVIAVMRGVISLEPTLSH
jgi:hypothetical protein